MDRRLNAIHALWDTVSEALNGKAVPIVGGSWDEQPIGAIIPLRDAARLERWGAVAQLIRRVEGAVYDTRLLRRSEPVRAALALVLKALDLAPQRRLDEDLRTKDGQPRVLRRVELVFYLATDPDDKKARRQVLDELRYRDDVEPHVRIRPATPEGVAADGWEEEPVLGTDHDHEPRDFFTAAPAGEG